MTFQLYSKRYGELHDTPEIPLAASAHLLPGATLKCYTTREHISYFLFQELPAQGFTIRVCHFYSFVKDALILLTDPLTLLRFGLSRSHDLYLPQLGRLQFLERGYNLLYVPHTLVEWTLLPRQAYAFVEIILPPHLLVALGEEYPVLAPFLQHHDPQCPAMLCPRNQVAGVEMMSWADLLLHAPGASLSTDAIATRLLRAALGGVRTPAQSNHVRLQDGDIEKVYEMSQLLAHSEEPPSLKVLSEKFDISIYRINGGFKQVHGHSALHHRKEEKMRLALQLMHNKEYSVKQLAYTLGYWPQNFSRAFKKRFGYSPGQTA